MKVLYIGQYTSGTTSKMRADQINSILKPEEFHVVDTHIPFYNTVGLVRSFGFRFKAGPLIRNINEYVVSRIEKNQHNIYELIWIDKGVFLTRETTSFLKKYTSCLVHFTPDMAFFENKSKKFERSLDIYDFAITTKNVEVDKYEEIIPIQKIILTTQGFSKDVHNPIISYREKENSVAFVGLAEKSRFEMAKALLQNEIHLNIAGMGWEKFAKQHEKNPFFHYYGKGVYGSDYCKFISNSKFGLGLLSKNFPELHTTRTFEIPACGTALLTERNKETTTFFEEEEVIFYSSTEELLQKVNFYVEHHDKLEKLIENGYKKVHQRGFDYETILGNILDKVLS